MKKILIQGTQGFIAKNLIAELANRNLYHKQKNPNLNALYEVYQYDIDSKLTDLEKYTEDCDFVCHLAGVNRPDSVEDFMKGNFGFTSELLALLKKNKNKAPVLITSSIQSALDNQYGKSKKAGEDLLLDYGTKNGVDVFIYRLPNVFGKWCRPNYNSAIATFCHNIAHDMDIVINDASYMMNLVYIDDVVNEIIDAIEGNAHKENAFCVIPVSYQITLGEIVDLLYSFKNTRKTLHVPDMSDAFTNKLYSTYLNYLPKNAFS